MSLPLRSEPFDCFRGGLRCGSVVRLGGRSLNVTSVHVDRDGAGRCVVVGTVSCARILAGRGPAVPAALGGLDVSRVREL